MAFLPGWKALWIHQVLERLVVDKILAQKGCGAQGCLKNAARHVPGCSISLATLRKPQFAGRSQCGPESIENPREIFLVVATG
jgi:hypothetical protein